MRLREEIGVEGGEGGRREGGDGRIRKEKRGMGPGEVEAVESALVSLATLTKIYQC